MRKIPDASEHIAFVAALKQHYEVWQKQTSIVKFAKAHDYGEKDQDCHYQSFDFMRDSELPVHIGKQ